MCTNEDGNTNTMVDMVNKVSESWFDTDSNDFKSGSKTVVECSSTACHAPSA